jgi:nitrogen fixation NifU-like protein
VTEAFHLDVQMLLADHSRSPRHWGTLLSGQRVYGSSPGCGDEQMLYGALSVGGGPVLSFQAKGCALSKACTSILLEHVEGWTWEQIAALPDDVLTSELGTAIVHSRPKCAFLGLGLLKQLAAGGFSPREKFPEEHTR